MSTQRNSWFIPAATAILAFLGAIGGSTISAHYQSKTAQEQIEYEKQRTILSHRAELIERLSRSLNMGPKMKALNDYLVVQADLQSLYTECLGRKEKGCTNLADNPKTVIEVSISRADLNADYASTIQLVKVYFSPAIQPLLENVGRSGEWWSPGAGPSHRNLLLAMYQEISAE